MAALNGDIQRYSRTPEQGYKWTVQAGPGTYYSGAVVTRGGNGNAKVGGGTTEPILGIYDGRAKTIAAGSTENIQIIRKSIVDFKTTNALAVRANVGAFMMVSNDNDIATHSGNNKVLGRVIDVDEANDILVIDMADVSD